MHAQVLILGSGPAGYTASVYTALAGLKTIQLMGTLPGGQITLSHQIENFSGHRSISGSDLSDIFKKQAEYAGVHLLSEQARQVNLSTRPFSIQTTADTLLTADALIIATGTSARWLNVCGEEQFRGHGISVCATCDGFFYRGKTVCVIGGGNTAAYEALFLAQTSSKVYLIYTEAILQAEQNLIKKIKQTQNITLIPNTQVLEFSGTQKLEYIHLKNNLTHKKYALETDGVFEAIGHIPNSDLFQDQLQIDKNGYIITDPYTKETSIKGVFACGDVQEPLYRQAIVAAGSGCRAALSAKHYLLNQNVRLKRNLYPTSPEDETVG